MMTDAALSALNSILALIDSNKALIDSHHGDGSTCGWTPAMISALDTGRRAASQPMSGEPVAWYDATAGANSVNKHRPMFTFDFQDWQPAFTAPTAAPPYGWRGIVEQLIACHEEPTCPAVTLAREWLAAEPPALEEPVAPELWRHLKTGGVYRHVAHALRESDLHPVVVYQATDEAARVWVRPSTEFYDGRFLKVAYECVKDCRKAVEYGVDGQSHCSPRCVYLDRAAPLPPAPTAATGLLFATAMPPEVARWLAANPPVNLPPTAAPLKEWQPIDMVLYCPNCGLQHVDAPDTRVASYNVEGEPAWNNPPHRSHLCRPEDGGCSNIWRPADVATNGVAEIKTAGKADTWSRQK